MMKTGSGGCRSYPKEGFSSSCLRSAPRPICYLFIVVTRADGVLPIPPYVALVPGVAYYKGTPYYPYVRVAAAKSHVITQTGQGEQALSDPLRELMMRED